MSNLFITLSSFLLTSQASSTSSSSVSSAEQVCGYAVLGENRVPLSACIALSPEMILGGFLEKRSGSLMLECGDDDGSIRVLQFADEDCEMYEEMHHLYSSSEAPIIGCNAGSADCGIRVRRELDSENCANSEFSENFEDNADDSDDAFAGRDHVYNAGKDESEMVFVSSVCHTSSLTEISYTLQCSAAGDRLLARFWNSATCGQIGEGRAAGAEEALSETDFFGNTYDNEPDEVHELLNGECAFGHRYFIDCPNLNTSGLYEADAMVDEDSAASAPNVVGYVVRMALCMVFVACMIA
jgi:hypothetical protein